MIPNERLNELAATGVAWCNETEFAAMVEQCKEANRLRKAIEQIDLTLRVPAAEYVPAIGDVFAIIDSLKGQTK